MSDKSANFEVRDKTLNDDEQPHYSYKEVYALMGCDPNPA